MRSLASLRSVPGTLAVCSVGPALALGLEDGCPEAEVGPPREI